MLKEKFLNQKYEIEFTDEDYEYYNSVRKSYLIDILEKTETIEHQLFSLSEKNDFIENKDSIYDCNRLAHSIKGTGYSYGFKFISEIAFCIEEILDYVLKHINIEPNIIQGIFCQCMSFNDLLAYSIKNIFLNTSNFVADKSYYVKLHKMINETDNLLKNNSIERIFSNKKNILICGNNNFIFNNIKRFCKNYKNILFHYAPGFLGAIYELSNKKIDIVFSEFSFKHFNALSLYSTLKCDDDYNNLPFYFIVSDFNKKMEDNNISKNIVLLKNNDLLKNIKSIIT